MGPIIGQLKRQIAAARRPPITADTRKRRLRWNEKTRASFVAEIAHMAYQLLLRNAEARALVGNDNFVQHIFTGSLCKHTLSDSQCKMIAKKLAKMLRDLGFVEVRVSTSRDCICAQRGPCFDCTFSLPPD